MATATRACRALLALLMPCVLAAGCAEIFSSTADIRRGSITDIVAADSVPAGTPIPVGVQWQHGPCEVPLGIRLTQRPDTVILEARTRFDASVARSCDADVAFMRDTVLSLPARAAGSLHIRALRSTGVTVGVDVRVY